MFEDPEQLEGYDVAQICKNGHVITSTAASNPTFRKQFCRKCGEGTILACTECRAEIQGKYHSDGVWDLTGYDKPNYCHQCGQPYPWTARAIEASYQLVVEDESLNEIECEQFRTDLRELVRETPQATLSATRIRKTLKRVAPATANAVRDIAIEIVSESIRRSIWGT